MTRTKADNHGGEKKHRSRSICRSYCIYCSVLFLLALCGCASGVRTDFALVDLTTKPNPLLGWFYHPKPLTPLGSGGTAFGNAVYDPVNQVWRLFYTNNTEPATPGPSTIYQVTGGTLDTLGNPMLALDLGAPGSWDSTSVGLPYVWYEAGQARPWRMMYRGQGRPETYYAIGLATSTDGVTWEREDTAGNALPVISISSVGNDGSGHIEITTATAHPWSTGAQIDIGGVTGTGASTVNSNPSKDGWTITVIDNLHFVLQGSTYYASDRCSGGVVSQPALWGTWGAWDRPPIDFGSVIKIGSTYYLFYDSLFSSHDRQTGVATSSDLVHWTKDPDNPIFSGADGYVDHTTPPGEDQNGTTDPTAGFFCPDVVYWPEADGSTRFVMIIPHYISGSSEKPTYDLYVSSDVRFYQADRTYIGKILRTDVEPQDFEGEPITRIDTPRIITDDITRNVATSTRTGNDVILVATVYTADSNWNHVLLTHGR